MRNDLVSLLKANIGMPLTPDLAAGICILAERVSPLVPLEEIARFSPEKSGDFVFAVEKMEEILGELRPIHLAHWAETEAHRHGLVFNPDYDRFIEYERAGRAILFTLRQDGRLLGNFSLYITRSMHTQTLMSREDTLFVMPEARRGRVAMRFIAYGENCLRQLGVRELNVSVKVVNKAGRFFQMIGYRHVENGLSKLLETE